jgi:hypothetical protein
MSYFCNDNNTLDIKQGKTSIASKARGIQDLINQKESLRNELYAELLGNVCQDGFEDKKRRVDLVGQDIIHLMKRKDRILGVDASDGHSDHIFPYEKGKA